MFKGKLPNKIGGKMLKRCFGGLLILLGIVLGTYVGIYLLLFGGITQLLEAIKANPINSMGVAWGIIKILFSGFVGWLIFGILSAISLIFLVL